MEKATVTYSYLPGQVLGNQCFRIDNHHRCIELLNFFHNTVNNLQQYYNHRKLYQIN